MLVQISDNGHPQNRADIEQMCLRHRLDCLGVLDGDKTLQLALKSALP